MVRVGAKRERPCMVLLHVAFRSAPLPVSAALRQQQQQQQQQQTSSSSVDLAAAPERFIWKSQPTAEIYASAVLARVRAWWELLGGVRYGLPDAVRLASAVWAEATTGSERKRGNTMTGDDAQLKEKKKQSKTMRLAERRLRRVSVTKRRSGVLRCAVQLSRSLYGDAAALHIFRAACACVTEVHVSMPLSTLSASAVGEGEDAEEGEGGRKRRRQRGEDGGLRMEQGCHAAVRVARVEHVVGPRKH